PAVRGDLVATGDCVAREFRRALDGAPARADCRFGLVCVEQLHNSPPASARAIFEMAIDAGIRQAVQRMAYLVYGFVPVVAVADRVFRALFEIDDEGHGDTLAARPFRLRPRPAVTAEIPKTHHTHC